MLTPLARALAVRWGNIDRPVGLKIHTRATPLMGGVAVYLAFVASAILVLPLSPPVIGLCLGGLAAVVVGVLDERLTLPPLVHLGGQIAAAVIAMVSGIGVLHSVSIPTASLSTPGFSLPLGLGFIITIIWLVAMMNTMNFLDGLDGLAGGVAAIAALLLAAWALEKHPYLAQTTPHHEDVRLPLALAGALLGFLPFNWHQARIFLGDSGSMFLGLALAAISIVGPTKLGTALVVLMIPVLDVAWAVVRRQMRGRSFLTGDKQHVYHRMLELGMSHTSTVVLLYVLVIGLALLDLQLNKVGKLVAFVLLAAVIGTSFIVLETHATRRTARSADQSRSLRGRPEDITP